MISTRLHEQNLKLLLAPLADLLARGDVSEVMVNGPFAIYIEREGRIEPTRCRFASAEELMAALRGIAQYAQRPLDPERPILEARLPDGSRVEAVLPPAAPDGPIVSIRRFSRSTLTLEDLVAAESLSRHGAELLSSLVRGRQNLLIAGGTGSGKTSLLNVAASCIPRDQRVVVIEDSRELCLPHEHVVQLEARPPDARGRGAVSVRQLFVATLRLRPDRIVVGEIRGPEALDLVQAMTSGHGGCLSTIHATSPRDALGRLETLALMNELELPLWALRSQIASGVHAVIQTQRGADGKRRMTEIAQVVLDGSGYRLTRLYPSEPLAAHARIPFRDSDPSATPSPEGRHER